MKLVETNTYSTVRSFFLPVMAIALLLWVSGCINPELVNSVGGNLYPTAPGDTRFLLVRVINETTATLDIPIAFEDGTGSLPVLVADLTPAGREVGVLFDWPILRVAIADLDNPLAPGIIATYTDGTSITVPSQLNALVAEQDFFKGDTVIYQFTADARSPSAIRVSVGRVDGSTQEGPFTRSDTFEKVELLLQGNGLVGGTPVQ